MNVKTFTRDMETEDCAIILFEALGNVHDVKPLNEKNFFDAVREAIIIKCGLDCEFIEEAEKERAINSTMKKSMPSLHRQLCQLEKKLKQVNERSEASKIFAGMRQIAEHFLHQVEDKGGALRNAEDELLRKWSQKFWPLLTGKILNRSKECERFFAVVFGDTKANSQLHMANDEARGKSPGTIAGLIP